VKKITPLLFIIVFFGSCTKLFLGDNPSNSAVDIFDEFWKNVDNTWPAFESKRVNWDSLYNVYRPQVNSTSSNTDLHKILTELLHNLKDTHTTIFPKDLPTISYYPSYPFNFYGMNWIKKNYSSNFQGNNLITYGLLSPTIGYVYIAGFQNPLNEYAVIDDILKYFGQVKGVIIDVRSNTGGGSNRSELIASRFADQKRTHAYVRFRTSSQRDVLTDFFSEAIAPSGSSQFKNKVAILTNRYSFSATEDFVLMMKSLPQVIHLGDSTRGGSETRPFFKELPNGWRCRVSSKLLCGLDKQPISKGIPPTIYVQTTKADSLVGKDTIIERAIFELSK
jgi:carboxyl-terminal processing protease